MISASSVIDLDVEKSGNFRTSEFRIKNNAKMFKILSSGLYKNKIRAILREFSTNAHDSHVINGNPNEPFLVKLPNNLDPTLTIRDYGVGLSEKEIREIYTTYGESTKDGSNDVNGTFGLGAKSVFSYTDSCTLNSYKDGVKTTYSLHINTHGVPECARLTGVKTQERNGIEIIIPVQRNDFDQFRREAELVYTFFTIKPKVTGNMSYRDNSFNNPPFMEEKNSWATYNDHNGIRLFDESRAILVMGNCGYPIDLNAVGVGTYNHWLFGNSYALLHVGIGEVDITVSRESLEYIPHTIDTIKKKIAEIEISYRKKLETEIANQPSYYDACLYYFKQPLRLGATYKNKTIQQYVNNPLYDDNVKAGAYDVYRFHAGHKKPNPDTNAESFYMAGKTYNFYLEDTDKKVYTKVQNHLNSSGYGHTGILLKTQDKAKIKKFKDALGLLDSHIINVSTLPDPPKQVRTKSPKVGGYRLVETCRSHNMSYCWERLDDLPPGAIVVGFDQYYALDPKDTRIRADDFVKHMANLPASFKIDSKAIYGLSREKFKKATGKGFVEFWGVFDKALDAEVAKNQTIYEELLEYDTLFQQSDKFPNLGKFFKNLDTFALLTLPPLLTKIKKIYDDVNSIKKSADAQKVLNLANEYRKGKIKAGVKLTPLIEELYQKAPMLHFYEWEPPYYRKKVADPVAAIGEYLRLILK